MSPAEGGGMEINMKNEIERQKCRIHSWEHLEKAYNNPMLMVQKECAKAVPGVGLGVSITDSLLSSLIQKQIQKNHKELLKCLKDASPEIVLEDVSEEEFIMDYVNLHIVVERLRSNEKIQFLANLFISAHCGQTCCNLDEYDEMINRLNMLSLREISMLQILHKYGESTEVFYEQIQDELDLAKDMTDSLLTSITKTGFCKEKTGVYLNYQGNSFYTTDLFSRFLALINVDDGLSEEDRIQRKKTRDEGTVYSIIEE